ncbi:FAD-dependent pyridine nucleotide-disulfide oxidoreductase [Serratia symbiotica str. 'Cinara cedri']|nr:FAD-dependent pyridine nucleotide-disulfide oxidoreductase [Serratia symbiotica str. 'Cinara cedri']
MITPKKKIVIVGGGAGGLELATRLGNKLGRKKKADIILVDHSPSHLWKPLLHAVATGSLDDGIDTLSYLAHAHNHYFSFQLGALININRNIQTLQLASICDEHGKELLPFRELTYDILVIALGSISNDFGILGVKDHCVFLDNPYQARSFHKTMLNLFLKHAAHIEHKKQVNIVIIGGGATGVELSAELYNTVKQLCRYGLKNLDNNILNVVLVEANERILPSMPKQISSDAHLELSKIGVRVLTNTIVTRVNNSGLQTNTGEYINADLIVWAAGIKAPDFMKDIGELETNDINQLLVKPTLQTTYDSHIFAIGDCSACPKKGGGFVPPRAQSAHQMALCCFTNILALMHEQKLKPYVYKDYGSLISFSHFSTIGSLMGNLIRGSMIIKGCVARLIYISLYRMHQVALHGYIKTFLIILVRGINRVLRPRLKMY